MTEEKPDLVLISVSSRIPEFWVDQPKLWFIQFEAAVAPQNAGDNAKFQLLIAKLGKQVIQQVADLLATPPETGKYDSLKARLLQAYEDSENRRIQKLIGDMQLGDQRPSELLRKMKTLAGTAVTGETLLVLWQNHLPVSVRTVLAASSLKDSEKLAAVADKVMETSRPVDVAAISGQDGNSLAAAIEKLTLEVAELHRGRPRQRRDGSSSGNAYRYHSQSRSKSRRRVWQQSEGGPCFFHFRFRERARKCRDPCSWKSGQGN
ncbi:hypothetical protein NE865_09907 [Phthorimaea operculella]|nr:hypothetical protein NE865_09907 [Phthorimaea operculella]